MTTSDNSSLDEYAQEMFDILANSPEGLVRDDLMSQLGVTEVSLFHRIKGALQDLLGANDTLNVVGDSSTNNEGGWTYSLQGDPAHPISTQYLVNKTKGILRRQKRQFMVQKALVKGTPGNTTVGRAARRLLRSQQRCMEDTLDVLIELGAGGGETLP